MLKSIMALQLLTLYWFGSTPIDPNTSKPSNVRKESSIMNLTLDCITDTVIVYIPDPSGVTICADDLINTIDTMIGCTTITFTLDDGFTSGTCLNYGVNQIFVGAFPITITAVDNCGNMFDCEVNVEIADSIAPLIICPTPDTVCNFIDAAVPFNLNGFLASGGVISDNTFDPMLPIQPSFFSYLGQDTLVDGCNFLLQRSYRIEDYVGLADTCIHTIAVQDTIDVRCPTSITVETPANTCDALVIPDFVIASNCDIDTIFNDTSNDSIFPASIIPYDVIYTFVSVCGDTSTCLIEFNVNDTILPTLRCPNDVSIDCVDNTAAGSLSDFILLGGQADDNCGLDPLTFQYIDSIAGSNACVTLMRLYGVADVFGLYGECLQTITVIDIENPVLTCPANLTIGTDEGECYAILTIPIPLVNDNCGIDTLYNFYSNIATDTFLSGNSTVIWFALDNCGNSDTCHVRVTVEDDEEPVVISPIMEEVDCSFSEVERWDDITDYTNAGGTVTDNCSSNFTLIFSDSILVSPDTLIRIYDIEDEAGNGAEVEHIIVITDDEPPLIIAPANVTISCIQDINDLGLTGSPSTDDDCGGDIDTDYNDVLLSGPCPRVYRRIWIAIDEAGNEARDTQLITQVDLFPPVFNSPPTALNNIDCDDPYPAQQTLSATDVCTGPAIVVRDTLPFVVNNCTGYTVTYVWTATDVCNNSAQQFVSFIVLPDVVSPLISDPADLTVSSDDGVCFATLVQSNPSTSDACSTVNVTKSPIGNTYNKGLTVVTWTATDACSNTSTAQQNITVIDEETPELTCKGLRTLDLSYGVNQLPANNFVQTVTDNCPGDLIFQARRMDTTCSPTGNVLGNNVIFCCDDANDTIRVVVRLTDASGNTAACMTNMIIKDKLAPVIQEPLRDISISCDYFIDLSNLSAFGTIVFNEIDRDTIDIDDDLFETLPGDFLDGWVTDNCLDGLTLDELTPLDQRAHNYGNIVRRFVVTDASGNSISLQQVITIIDTDPLTRDDITWPADINITDCTNIPPDTSDTGSPIIDYDDICTIPAATYKDQIFDDPTSGCLLIRRKWSVIDWGQYVANTNIGIWIYTQNIHLVNSIDPTFVSSCANRTVCAVNAECDEVVRLGALGDDDCTDTEDLHYDYTVDLFSDGSINHSEVADTFEIRMARGIHTITWRVEDKCGNLTNCSYIVQVKECKAPTPVCMNGLSTNLVNDGTSVVWAIDFNIGSSDNCTPKNQLKYSFSSNILDTGLTLTCDDADTDVQVSMWVTDLDSNQSKCNTYIKVTDLQNICPDTIPDNNVPTISIAGRIATEDNDLIKNVAIQLTDGANHKVIKSDETGNFLFNNIGMYANYKVAPVYNEDWLNGVSTLDLVMMQRHILAIKKIDSPYKLIAADANSDTKISASDLVELRKLILGVNKEIASNKSWRFVDKTFVFPNPNYPWPFNESLDYNNLDVNMMSSDFIAVKVGDINGSLSTNINIIDAENREQKELILSTNDEYFESNKYINVPISASGIKDMIAMQLNLKVDQSYLRFVGIMSEGIEISKDNYHYDDESGILTIAYHNENIVELSQNSILFTLQFNSIAKNKLSNVISITTTHISSEAYDGNEDKYSAMLRYNDSMDALSVAQNVPNPFSEQTEVKFFIYDDGLVDLSIFDNSGTRVYNSIKPYNGGMNKVIIGKDELGDKKGVFFLHISTGERNEIKKMIRIN